MKNENSSTRRSTAEEIRVRDDLLSLLSAEEPVPEAALLRRLKLTEAELVRMVYALQEQGFPVLHKEHGLRLAPEEDGLLPVLIRKALATNVMGRGEILYAPEMGSTNTMLKVAAAAHVLPAGSLAVCGRQTGGKGRLNRVWQDNGAGEMLPCSLLLRPALPPEKTPLLTLAVAVAAAEAIGDFGLRAGIKWPNDVVINGRKCVGILCEALTDPDGARCVVVGAGFNVNQSAFAGELAEKATSLRLEGGKRIGRRALLCRYLLHMEQVAQRLDDGAFEAFFQSYSARSVTLGSRVRVLGATEDFTGVAERIDDTGALWVREEKGISRRVISGDVSVRGVMGYV